MSITITPKSQTSEIKQFVTINNRIRVKLGITMEEFCVCQAIEELRAKSKPLGKYILYKETSVPEEQINDMVNKLVAIGLLEKLDSKVYVSVKWKTEFSLDKEFDNNDDMDPGLWQIFRRRGNKAAALSMYKKAVKTVPIDTLKKAAVNYITAKEEEGAEFKHIMHLSSWLNPQFRHWEDEIQTGKIEKQKGVLNDEWQGKSA